MPGEWSSRPSHFINPPMHWDPTILGNFYSCQLNIVDTTRMLDNMAHKTSALLRKMPGIVGVVTQIEAMKIGWTFWLAQVSIMHDLWPESRAFATYDPDNFPCKRMCWLLWISSDISYTTGCKICINELLIWWILKLYIFQWPFQYTGHLFMHHPP